MCLTNGFFPAGEEMKADISRNILKVTDQGAIVYIPAENLPKLENETQRTLTYGVPFLTLSPEPRNGVDVLRT